MADHIALVLGMIFLGVALLAEKEGILGGLGAALFLGGFLYVLVMPAWICAKSAAGPDRGDEADAEEPDAGA